jgi:bifunctional DNA-binding transcriptional regulator/antitoxin component of YhaV-PrlF toxin-antitoxin module
MIITIAENGQLNLPPEIQSQIQAGDEYEVYVREDSIFLKKLSKPLNWSELSRRIEELGPDSEQPTLQEISEIVKEVRRERRAKNE